MTARANNVEPYAYLHYLFEHLPAATVEQIEALLPWNITPVQLAEHQKKQDQLPLSHCEIRRHRRRGLLR